MRPDLRARRQRYHGRSYWVVKEPVGLNYFRFHEEEYAILCMLDGVSSMEDIKERFEREFTPQKITFADLQQFIGMLHRSGLVISESAGQGQHLKKRRDERKRKEVFGKFANVFAVRFRGIDPERLLNFLITYTRWMFHPFAAMFFVSMGLVALTLIAVEFEMFRSRLPTFHEFFGLRNWIYLGITLGAVKVLHEFGHGLSCKYFGGECHEMGFMFLVFTPCLYCNVSDSWMLPNKWHRVVIAAAGMYVEMILASLATFIWWFTEPGLLNHICLSVMFICSVSTLLFNGNPLLRFDGYYILMDISEIPNLRQKSTDLLKRFMTNFCLGIEQPDNPFLPQENRFFFGLYTIAAVIYRWVVVFSILMFLNSVLEPYGLKAIGRAIGAIGLIGLVVQPIWKLGKFFYVPGRMHKVKKPRLIATVSALALVGLFVGFMPMPYHVDAAFTVQPRGADVVFASTPGRIVAARVAPGETVEKGQVIAVLKNLELDRQIAELHGDLKLLKIQLDTLRKQRVSRDETIGRQIPELEEMIASTEEQIGEKETQRDRLVITAPRAGTVLPAAHRPAQPSGDGRLPSWSGTPLDKKNLNATLSRTDVICQIGEPDELEVILVIDQADVDFVNQGHDVEFLLDALPKSSARTVVEAIGDEPLNEVPPGLAIQAGGPLETVSEAGGVMRPLHTSYPARGVVGEDHTALQIGMRGQAKIYTGWQPLGSRLYRFVARTFHFEL
jgi:putative peptide zinc metalloprotease protein